jgi:hypothetical protein
MVSAAFQSYFSSLARTQGICQGGDEWVKDCFDLIRYILKVIGKPVVEETSYSGDVGGWIVQTDIG